MKRLAKKLLNKYVGTSVREEFFGDLEESYEDRRASKGKFVADVFYLFDALHLIYGFSSTTSKYPTRHAMFTGNMFRIAWRNAIRHKQFTILNLLGLTIGIATCLAIGLYVYDESTYDTFYPKGDRIYRVNYPMIWGDWNTQFASTGPGVAEAMIEDIPDFEQVARMYNPGESTIRINGDQPNTFVESNFYWADSNVFKIFDFPFIAGDPATALTKPNGVVVTQRTAQRYFGNDDPMGKLIEWKVNDSTYTSYTVTGVMADIPKKSHIDADAFASLYSIPMFKTGSSTWIWTIYTTYGLVKEGTDIAALREKMQLLPPKWAAATTQKVFNQDFNSWTKGKPWTLYLQPLREIYLGGAPWPAWHRYGPSGNPQFVVIFSVIGILVLALSCINFMNLSTARSGTRAKEVGIRKVLGSDKIILVRQFIVESTLFVLVATVAALGLTQLSLGAFNLVADKQLDLFAQFSDIRFIGILIAFVIALGVLAGSYPAFYLSAFRPAETLKGKVRAGFKRSMVRNSLVVFQFTVSIALIICTFFVQKQLSYAGNLNVGVVKDNVLQLQYMEQLRDVNALKNKLEGNSEFTHVALSHSIPPNVWEGDRYKAEGPNPAVVDLSYLRCDEQYLPLLGVEFLVGRDFDPTNAADKHKIILNETAVKTLGWGTRDQWANDSPLGKHVVQAFGEESKLEVIGVVKDFNFNPVKDKILPLLIMHNDNDLHWSYHSGPLFLSMRINSAAIESNDDLQEIIDKVRADVKSIDPSAIFQYTFMDEAFDNSFRTERRMGVILNLFTALAVIIACLGLFGLSAFSAEQRLKELGIRKVMGAKVYELVVLFSSEFTKLVGIAILLATPIAWFFADKWLSSYAYRTPINAWVFIVAALSALAIAAITISYQAIAAARTNPVETLRNE
ncbi:MAG: ABC transporter permease [Bacteroidota bacterium]